VSGNCCRNPYFEKHRQVYYDRLLAVSQKGAWTAWLRFFLQGVAEQARDAVLRARRLQGLREGYRERFQTSRAAFRLLQVVDLLFARPLVTVGQVAETLDVSHQSATRYVEALEQAGVLHEITGQARNRVYRANEILETIEAPLEVQP
jgi:Fic family protein